VPKYHDMKIYLLMKINFACCFIWVKLHFSEHRLRVFENIVLRRIFGPRREQVASV